MTTIRPIHVTAGLLLLISCLSCSVKEDRDACPAYLLVRSDGHVGEAHFDRPLTYNIAAASDRAPERTAGPFAEFAGTTGHIFRVPRRERVDVTVAGGLRDMAFIGGLLRITPGNQCDSIVCGGGTIWIPGDTGELAVPLHRNYCCMKISVAGSVSLPFPYHLVVLGGVDGFTLPDIAPHAGPFRHRCEVPPARTCEARVPRQLDDSLRIEARSDEDGELVAEMHVGEVVARMGYDWSAPDLDDIAVEIDFARTSLTVTVNDWTECVELKIVI